MANVSRDGDAERGQLFLVGALSLAVLFVALAVLLNAAIFTENLATQGAAPGSGDAVEYRESALGAAGGAVTGVNYRNNSSYGELNDAFRRGVGAWSAAAGRHAASQSHAANASVGSVTNGTRLARDAAGNFTDRNGNATWTLARDVRVRNFSANVSKDSLESGGVLSNVSAYRDSTYFRVEFEDADGRNWTAYVHQANAGSDVAVTVVDGSNSLSSACTVDPGGDGYAVVDFTNASVGGTRCEPLAFYGEMNEPYTVRYDTAKTALGSATVEGRYALVVSEREGSLDTTPYYAAGNGQPYHTPAVYAATVELHYRAPTVDYEARVRVAPGEPDA